MRFSSIIAGPRARKPAVLPLPGSRFEIDESGKGAWVGDTVPVDVRALRSDEHARVLAGARRFAVEQGIADPTEDDELYVHGAIIHTLALACVDVDSPLDAPRMFFDGGIEQILESEALTPEVLAYLYEVQQLHQDEINPLLKNQSPAEYLAAVAATAEGDMGFFVSSRPGMQWSFVRTMAVQLVSLTRPESQPGSSSEPQPPTSGQGTG